MNDPLALLLHDGVIDEVVARLKSGKEADIYLVRHGGEIVAAKLYKERHVRSFKNDAAYREGRLVRDTRTQRAMDRGSRFGRQAAEDAWKTKESDALFTLHAAGVRVPRPVLFHEGVLLMEAVVDPEGHPAPRLVDAAIPRERAAELYADLRQQAVRMLACDLVHGDLSPYNVLLAWDGPTVIDFPQVVGAAHNSQAERFFARDLETIRRFFAAIDPGLSSAAGDAREIWRAYVRRELGPDFVPTGRPPEQRGAHGAPPRRGEPGTPRDGRRDGRAEPRGRSGEQRHPDRGGGDRRDPPQGHRGAPDQRRGAPPDHRRGAPPAHRGPSEPRRGPPPDRRPGAPEQRRDARAEGRGGSRPMGPGKAQPPAAGGRGGPARGRGRSPAPIVTRVVRPLAAAAAAAPGAEGTPAREPGHPLPPGGAPDRHPRAGGRGHHRR